MPANKLKDFLDSNQVKYVSIQHSPAYTAQEVAASAHVPGKALAKTVIVKADGAMAMAVVPAMYQVDLDLLRGAAGARNVEMATEEDFGRLFPDCQPGAMPPFGNLYATKVFADETLREEDEIAFNAGSHSELVRMKYSDFERLVKPKVARIARVS